MADFPATVDEFVELLFPDIELLRTLNEAEMELISKSINRVFHPLEHLVITGVKDRFHQVCQELANLTFVLLTNLHGEFESRCHEVYRAIERVAATTGLKEKQPQLNEELFVALALKRWPTNSGNHFIVTFYTVHFKWQ